ncbi:MAG TPA: hypothetical protein VK497_01100 [Candidatus Saccharimonadales bacterium]|nr:hypothetical protein [Candidatus Saccharimonadales bacterium]
MKRKYIIGIILAILVIGIGAWYVITDIQSSQKNKQETVTEESSTGTEDMPSSMPGMDH